MPDETTLQTAYPDLNALRPVRPLPAHRPSLGDAELAAVAEVFGTRWLGKGEFTQRFEDTLREFLGVEHVIAVSSGTAALHVALEALELAPDDEILVPSMTFAGTIQAIVAANARPVFCDVHATTCNLDVGDACRRATSRTRVIMPIHYGGTACDLEAIRATALTKGWHIVEDAAHAFGTRFRGEFIGAGRDLTCFSFDATKNITCGCGGAICTDNDVLARRMIPLRNIGIDVTNSGTGTGDRRALRHIAAHGYRYQMSNVNAAIGLEQMKRIDTFRARKLQLVHQYDKAFANLNEIRLLHRNLDETSPFSYVVRVLGGKRDKLMSHLRACAVDCLVQFHPNHLQPAFKPFRGNLSLPITEKLGEEIVTLPLFVEMTDEDARLVIDSVRSFWHAA